MSTATFKGPHATRNRSLTDWSEILVSGLEGRYYVRGGMDHRWSSLDQMITDLRDDVSLKMLFPPDRERVLSAALQGWQHGRPEETLDGYLPAHRLWHNDRIQVSLRGADTPV